MNYKLKFTYSTGMVFDYLKDCWLTVKQCELRYGERVLMRAMGTPGMTVTNEYEKSIRSIV